MLVEGSQYHQTNLLNSDLLSQLDPSAPLLQLTTAIPWQDFDKAFTKRDYVQFY